MDPLALPPIDDPFEIALDAAVAAIRALPGPFGEQLASVAIVVEQEPSPSSWPRSMPTACWGSTRACRGPSTARIMRRCPSKITLFRGPLMRRHRTPEALRDGVEATLIHELGHHLGISDARIDELQDQRRLRG